MDKEQMNWRSFATNDAIKTQWNDPGTPMYYVIDHKGVIRHKWFGSPGEKAIDAALDKLIEEAATAPVPKDGLAALYPGDEGIERDPRVLFVEDFETGDVAKIGERWGNITSPKNIDLSAEIPPNSPGTRALHMVPNASLFTHTKGVDRLHVRFYVQFHSKTGYLHHFVALAAERVPTPWPQPRAGQKPAGDGWFNTIFEPNGKSGDVPPPGVWHFYSNWHEMKGGPNGYWGNHFDATQEPVEPGLWYCIEAMVQCNSTPDAADGEQAFWVDGKPIGHFKGICWRTSDQLKLNSFWLNYYVTDSAAQANNDKDPNRVYEVWFDDIVLATEYIGPVSGQPKSGKKVAVPGKSALSTPGQLLPHAPATPRIPARREGQACW